MKTLSGSPTFPPFYTPSEFWSQMETTVRSTAEPASQISDSIQVSRPQQIPPRGLEFIHRTVGRTPLEHINLNLERGASSNKDYICPISGKTVKIRPPSTSSVAVMLTTMFAWAVLRKLSRNSKQSGRA